MCFNVDGCLQINGNVSKERKASPNTWKRGTSSCVNSDQYVTMIQQFLHAFQERDAVNIIPKAVEDVRD
ncbi:hypothetical protein TNCV_475171 [Trichonephila clavipes]|nr:hypothetical protein TNCV_475171 [Trichonephila clavipes]